jgi:F0F1-type ATP synthase gamma subunit
VSPIVGELIGYKQPTVWFQRYLSLSVQEVGRIDLINRVKLLGSDAEARQADIISPREYLFEPNVEEVVRYLESVMMEIALSQVILESRLAQYASRFTAMSKAKKRSQEMKLALVMSFNRAKRGEADDRIKEIVNAMNALQS